MRRGYFLMTQNLLGAFGNGSKTLRKRNVSVIFATQSLSDIANSSIAPALIESCPSRIFLPNERALEPQQHKIYEAFGLNVRQIAIISQAAAKREYYFQSSKGNRLFDLALGPIALAFTASSSKQDHQLLDQVIAEGGGDFVSSFLTHKNLEWANSLIDIYPQNQ